MIELDGAQHGEHDAMLHDHARACYLESRGLHVIRFTNREIEEDFEAVCIEIDRKIAEYTK